MYVNLLNRTTTGPLDSPHLETVAGYLETDRRTQFLTLAFNDSWAVEKEFGEGGIPESPLGSGYWSAVTPRLAMLLGSPFGSCLVLVPRKSSKQPNAERSAGSVLHANPK